MDELNDQQVQRLDKLNILKELGVSPYGLRYDTTHTVAEIIASYSTKHKEELDTDHIPCKVAGRIVALRRFGKAAFATLQDGGDRLQVYLKQDLIGVESYTVSKEFDLGDWIGTEGRLFRTKTDELTVEVKTFTFLAKGLQPLPEKWHGLTDIETRYRQRYVDLIANPDIHQIFRMRSQIVSQIRTFLTERGFLEVETPMMQPIPGGAAARPFVTHHNTLDIDLYLRIAPELYLKRLIVGGLRRVFEINRNFRNEGISTIHNPEFTMLEFYQAYADYQDLMDLTETLISSLATTVCGRTTIDYQGQSIDLTPPWRRLPYLDAVVEVNQVDPAILTDLGKAVEVAKLLNVHVEPEKGLIPVLTQLFEATVEPTLIQPTFITDFPIEISPLARRKDANPALSDRFELFIGGRELANGFSELNDPIDQRQRFEAQVEQRAAGDDEAHYLDEDFLRALEYGMPPTAGEGIGIDRLVMLLTNQTSIRDVILFPQLRPDKSL
ncbi:lysine--tRNA ligase [Candidatus Nitrospira salsa]